MTARVSTMKLHRKKRAAAELFHRSGENPIEKCWEIIAPTWPLKNMIAVNPLKGLEELPIEEAIEVGAAYFQQRRLPQAMEAVNRETIKWLQPFLDEGESSIALPYKEEGFYSAFKKLAPYDHNLHGGDAAKISFLMQLPMNPEEALEETLSLLAIPKNRVSLFLRLLLTTLPGWASAIKYRSEWQKSGNSESNGAIKIDYLAVRALITALLWPEAKRLLTWHFASSAAKENAKEAFNKVVEAENNTHTALLQQLKNVKPTNISTPRAQLVFCIDVRSEPFRRALEKCGEYETFGFAGFFGLPISIKDPITGDSTPSCPVLLSPEEEICRSHCNGEKKSLAEKDKGNPLSIFKEIYHALKNSSIAPFLLVEGMGPICGLATALNTFSPRLSTALKNAFTKRLEKNSQYKLSVDTIPLEKQVSYLEKVLKTIGVRKDFAPLVLFCGHGSGTKNNAFAASLDCGACGGRSGGENAQLLAAIANRPEVRKALIPRGIEIPETTQFIAALHNTTTDDLLLYSGEKSPSIERLRNDANIAQKMNAHNRLKSEGRRKTIEHARTKASDWAEVRPEWGLAKNCAFIAAPRALTHNIDLGGRCFLHSYDQREDRDGTILRTILTAPMVVAQWINAQYLFSTLDNSAFGAGSKVTNNITGKFGAMQGNGSDLMTGLSHQSLYENACRQYHEPLRLMTVVYASKECIDPIVKSEPVLKQLFGNGWVKLVSIDPITHHTSSLQRDLSWQ